MLGSLVGDIVGSVYERYNCKDKDFKFFSLKGRPTDDSVMSLAVAKAITDCNGDYSKLGEEAVKSMVEVGRQYPNCGYGGTFIRWIFSNNHPPYGSYGNGAAMRISPVGFAATNLEEVKTMSRAVTEVSHDHPEAIKGAEATAVAIFLARSGITKEEIKEYIQDHYYDLDFTIDGIRDTYEFDVSCQGSVPQALESFFESNDYEDAIRNAVSLGGDSDTIAAICGGVASAFYGVPENIRETALTYLDDYQLEILDNFEKKFEPTLNKENTQR